MALDSVGEELAAKPVADGVSVAIAILRGGGRPRSEPPSRRACDRACRRRHGADGALAPARSPLVRHARRCMGPASEVSRGARSPAELALACDRPHDRDDPSRSGTRLLNPAEGRHAAVDDIPAPLASSVGWGGIIGTVGSCRHYRVRAGSKRADRAVTRGTRAATPTARGAQVAVPYAPLAHHPAAVFQCSASR
jgi:hypothetical protein